MNSQDQEVLLKNLKALAKENNLDRANMLSKINPHDEYVLDWAVNIKSKIKDIPSSIIIGIDV